MTTEDLALAEAPTVPLVRPAATPAPALSRRRRWAERVAVAILTAATVTGTVPTVIPLAEHLAVVR